MENLWENLFLVAFIVLILGILFAAYWFSTRDGSRSVIVALLAVAVPTSFFIYSGERMTAVRGDETRSDRSHIEDLYGIYLPEDFVVGSRDPQVVEFDDGERLCVVSWEASISGTPPPRLKCSEGDVVEPPHAD